MQVVALVYTLVLTKQKHMRDYATPAVLLYGRYGWIAYRGQRVSQIRALYLSSKILLQWLLCRKPTTPLTLLGWPPNQSLRLNRQYILRRAGAGHVVVSSSCDESQTIFLEGTRHTPSSAPPSSQTTFAKVHNCNCNCTRDTCNGQLDGPTLALF